MIPLQDPGTEWLEADGLGGFASGPVHGARFRRYHALLLAATQPPSGRVVLVNGIEAWLEAASGRIPLTTQRYDNDVLSPDIGQVSGAFTPHPWPTWTLDLPNGTRLVHEVLMDRDAAETVLRWRRTAGAEPCRLLVRPLLSGRDYHALHRENAAFRFDAVRQGGNVAWRPYPGLPAVAALTNGTYRHEPDWYRRFLYAAERDRGLDHLEDLASPGVFSWDLAAGDPEATHATMVLRTGDGLSVRAAAHAERTVAAERTRRSTPSTVLVESYLADRDPGLTVIAGYPWFTDWGRDTFISMRGLLLATGRLDDAGRVLSAWAGLVSEGMLPNRFPDNNGAPEYNSVDASLWFVVVAHEFLEAAGSAATARRATLEAAMEAILLGYAAGTRHGIGLDGDGLLHAGAPELQLTWMDAKVGDWVVTPRRGKPVEVQALWINALLAGARWSPRWAALAAQARASFASRFPDPATGGLVDVVDVNGEPGRVDRLVRPNQVFAVGGLPFPLLDGAAARGVVDLLEQQLLTPMGLRTLAPDQPGYLGRYRGGPLARDAAYHQGTAWPWLLGPFTEAWLRVHGPEARNEAARRFLAPLREHMVTAAGLGHVSEVADGDAPFTPGGCPFQAWSMGEFLRMERMLAPFAA